MTPEAQRIVIAEACGWILFPGDEKLMSFNQWRHESGDFRPLREPPDYLNDLNAMHEAEKVLTAEQAYEYHCRLAGKLSATAEFRYAISAPAPQRAEELLRTIGKWTE